MMHHLLRKMGREIVRRESADDPGKRQFLIDAQEIYDVLADETVSPYICIYISSHSYGFLNMFKQVKLYNLFPHICFQGTEKVLGISFNMSEIKELSLGERAFSGMRNLHFLRFYKKLFDKDRLHLHEGLDCLPLPRKLKLLHWEACPMKQISVQFRPECLVELNMTGSKLKKLWDRVSVSSLTIFTCTSILFQIIKSPDVLLRGFDFSYLAVSKRWI